MCLTVQIKFKFLLERLSLQDIKVPVCNNEHEYVEIIEPRWLNLKRLPLKFQHIFPKYFDVRNNVHTVYFRSSYNLIHCLANVGIFIVESMCI